MDTRPTYFRRYPRNLDYRWLSARRLRAGDHAQPAERRTDDRGPIEARKAAREQLGNGADWIKVYMTHRSWVDKEGNLVSQPTLTLEEIKAITDEAHGVEAQGGLPRVWR